MSHECDPPPSPSTAQTHAQSFDVITHSIQGRLAVESREALRGLLVGFLSRAAGVRGEGGGERVS